MYQKTPLSKSMLDYGKVVELIRLAKFCAGDAKVTISDNVMHHLEHLSH